MRMILSAGGGVAAAWPTCKKYYKDVEKYSDEEKHAFYTKFFTKLNKRAFHIHYVVEGRENVPDGQCLFVINHTAMADPVFFYLTMDRPLAFLAKKEAFNMPFVGKIAYSMGSEFIDRGNLREELKSFRKIDERLKERPSLSFAAFPEGTRSLGPVHEVAEFHPGTFKIATRRNFPIVPVAMWLPGRILDQTYHFKKYPIQVRFLKAVMPEEYENMTNQEIANITRDRICTALEELKARDYDLVKALNGYSDKKMKKVQYSAPAKKKV